jgi:very-short-patch-repair endonuclease
MAENEVLVALLQQKRDLAILETENWYRIPVAKTPRGWPPQFLAFYQPRAFRNDAFRIRYFGKIASIEQVKRHDLFPNELISAKSNKLYHRISLEHLEKLPRPILARLPRKVVFIPTTWQKFIQAEELNDLFNESPLEDLLWDELNRRNIPAERQWPVNMSRFAYHLDFALFCNQGKMDVETDGDTWHSYPERIASDNRRNNDITAKGWHVLRFNTSQIQEQCAAYCLPRIQETINTLGGLCSDGLVSRKFDKNGENTQQLSLI